MADYIKTYSKIKFTPLEPKDEDISIDDIAHALSLMSRANGHFEEFYSVAQHCIFCCEEALARGYGNKVALACLLHDGSEAYLADITRPVKKNLEKYLEIEEVLQEAIYKKFIGEELTVEERKQISSVDNSLLYYEFIHYMDEKLEMEVEPLVSNPNFKFMEFKEVENQYKELLKNLSRVMAFSTNN